MKALPLLAVLLLALTFVPSAAADTGDNPCANPTTPLWNWLVACATHDPGYGGTVMALVDYVRCDIVGGPAC